MKTSIAMAALAACLMTTIPAMAQQAGNHMGADDKTTTGAPGTLRADPMVKDGMSGSSVSHGSAMPNGGMANTASSDSMKMDSKMAMKMKKSKKTMAMKKPMTDPMPMDATPSAGGMSSGGMTAPSH